MLCIYVGFKEFCFELHTGGCDPILDQIIIQTQITISNEFKSYIICVKNHYEQIVRYTNSKNSWNINCSEQINDFFLSFKFFKNFQDGLHGFWSTLWICDVICLGWALFDKFYILCCNWKKYHNLYIWYRHFFTFKNVGCGNSSTQAIKKFVHLEVRESHCCI